MKVEIRKVENAEEEKAVISTRQMTASVRRAAKLLSEEETTLVGILDGESVHLPAHLIYRVEVVEKHTYVHTKDKMYEVTDRINELEKSLGRFFLRSGRNRLVNARKIASVKGDFSSRLRATLLNGDEVYLSAGASIALKHLLGV